MSTRARVLFVTPVTPLRQNSGAEQRSHLMWRSLCEHYDCDVLQLEEGEKPLVERLDGAAAGILVRAVLRPHGSPLQRFRPQPDATAEIERALGRSLQDYALVVGRYLWPICQLAMPPGLPAVVDLDDWRYRRDRSAPWSVASFSIWLRKSLANALAGRQLHRFAGAFAVSDRDARELERCIPVRLLPNIPAQVPDSVTPVPASRQLLFVGSLWYAPNAEAVDWMLARVWPQVRAQVPDAQLLLAGSAPRITRERWARHAGVEAPGFVDDISQAYAQSSGVLVPVLSGGGSNIKLLEAMVHGRPCVVTALVHSAFEAHLKPELHYHVCSSPKDFAGRAISMLLRPETLQSMADSARLSVLSEFNAPAFRHAISEHLRELLQKKIV